MELTAKLDDTETALATALAEGARSSASAKSRGERLDVSAARAVELEAALADSRALAASAQARVIELEGDLQTEAQRKLDLTLSVDRAAGQVRGESGG